MKSFLGFGVGLRPQHFAYVTSQETRNEISADWFEIISENFMGLENSGNWGRHHRFLEDVRSRFPVVMHGVSLSIGSCDPLNSAYLRRLKELSDMLQPAWVSDHLCWTGCAGENLHDLLPLPYTCEAVEHVVTRISQVQDHLKQQIVLENVSAYLTYRHSEMQEHEFIAAIVQKSGCGVLLDVNNVYVSAVNNGIDPCEFIAGIPREAVRQFHLAGHRNFGSHCIDTHDQPVCDEVWQLYKFALERFGAVSTLIEWDDNIPEFPTLEIELKKARAVSAEAAVVQQDSTSKDDRVRYDSFESRYGGRKLHATAACRTPEMDAPCDH